MPLLGLWGLDLRSYFRKDERHVQNLIALALASCCGALPARAANQGQAETPKSVIQDIVKTASREVQGAPSKLVFRLNNGRTQVKLTEFFSNGRIRKEMGVGDGALLMLYDGKRTWLRGPHGLLIGTGDLETALREEGARGLRPDFIKQLTNKKAGARLLTPTNYLGTECVRIQAKDTRGNIVEHWFDKQSLLRKLEIVRGPANQVRYRLFESYREFQGVMLPGKTTERLADPPFEGTIELLLATNDCPDSVFRVDLAAYANGSTQRAGARAGSEAKATTAVILGEPFALNNSDALGTVISFLLLNDYARQHRLGASAAEIQEFLHETEKGSPAPPPNLEILSEWGERLRAQTAAAYVEGWKLNKHLFDRYGGKVIFQQMGPEPIGAMAKFLRSEEKEGRLKILDAQCAEGLWSYYESTSHAELDKKEAAQAMREPWWRMDAKQQPKGRASSPESDQESARETTHMGVAKRGQIIRLSGVARVRRAQSNSWIPASASLALGQGDMVQTASDEGAMVDIALHDGKPLNPRKTLEQRKTDASDLAPAGLRLLPNTALSLASLPATAPAATATDLRFQLLSGILLGTVNSNQGSAHVIQVGGGVIRVRSGCYQVEAAGRLRMLNGQAFVAGTNLTSEVTVSAGQSLDIRTGSLSRWR